MSSFRNTLFSSSGVDCMESICPISKSCPDGSTWCLRSCSSAMMIEMLGPSQRVPVSSNEKRNIQAQHSCQPCHLTRVPIIHSVGDSRPARSKWSNRCQPPNNARTSKISLEPTNTEARACSAVDPAISRGWKLMNTTNHNFPFGTIR